MNDPLKTSTTLGLPPPHTHTLHDVITDQLGNYEYNNGICLVIYVACGVNTAIDMFFRCGCAVVNSPPIAEQTRPGEIRGNDFVQSGGAGGEGENGRKRDVCACVGALVFF